MSTSFLALLSAVAMHIALGMAWYSPKGFGTQWAILMGWPRSDTKLWEEKKKDMKKIYIWSTIMAVIMAYVLSNFISLLKINTVSDAAQLGFWFWFGLVAPTSFINVLLAKTSKKLWLINVGYHLTTLILMSMIITLWQ